MPFNTIEYLEESIKNAIGTLDSLRADTKMTATERLSRIANLETRIQRMKDMKAEFLFIGLLLKTFYHMKNELIQSIDQNGGKVGFKELKKLRTMSATLEEEFKKLNEDDSPADNNK